jgi:hypothetical protein
MFKCARFISIIFLIVLGINACTLSTNPVQPSTPTSPVVGLSMTISYQPNNYDAVGQEISYHFLIENTSVTAIPGPITVTGDKITTATCLDLTMIGNLDPNLDPNETVSCTGTYTITQSDLDARSVMLTATATAGGYTSTTLTIVKCAQYRGALTLTMSPNPQSFNSVGQTIIYSYVITNSGQGTLGPAQFKINDDKIGAAINCGPASITLAPTGTVTCSASYIITEDDVTAGSVTNSAYAFDGTITSKVVTATINRGVVSNPSNLQPGSITPQVTVIDDEDKDGLSDSDEHILGTDPLDQDTDDDGLSDGTEIYLSNINPELNLSPLSRDTDGDGLSDYDEYTSGSSWFLVATSTITPPTNPIETPNSTQTAQAAFYEVDLQYDKTMKSNIAFYKPVQMKLNDTVLISLVLAPSMSVSDLKTQAVIEGDLATSTAEPATLVMPGGQIAVMETGLINIAPQMKAELTSAPADAFIVGVVTPTEQMVSTREVTVWKWNVTAKKEGEQALDLVISRLVELDGSGQWHSVEEFRANIVVDVTFADKLSAFDWKWLIGTFLSGLLIPLFFWWLNNRKKEQTDKRKPPAPRNRRNYKSS